MTFPQLVPTSRQFDAGNFPVKTYLAQDGSEIQLLYGNRRVRMKLALVFQNISDEQAALFVQHFHDQRGTYRRFTLGRNNDPPALRGWEADKVYLSAGSWGSLWRYENSPRLDSVYPGVSTVSVNLIAAAGPEPEDDD